MTSAVLQKRQSVKDMRKYSWDGCYVNNLFYIYNMENRSEA